MIEIKNRAVFRSTVAGKAFLTKTAAIRAEARALIRARYPTEQAYDDPAIGCFETGFHWRELHRSDVLYRRVCRLIKQSLFLEPAP